ncbi:MAG: alpha/beta fold hydrolase [Actinomycetota bacterium]|nr:alpha/beta fold hydrolase [Actinomycetota bacterium]
MAGTATAGRARVPEAPLEALVERYDASALFVPGGRARIRLEVTGQRGYDVVLRNRSASLRPASSREPDAVLRADHATWGKVAGNGRAGMSAFRRGLLEVRRNLHLGAGFLAATSGSTDPGRLELSSLRTKTGTLAMATAGTGRPLVCLHGLGGTKASFLTTIADLAGDDLRVIALDIPGFGDSVKPIGAPYDAKWFARTVIAALDALEIDSAHLAGNSMGGRVAMEMGFQCPDRVDRLVLMSPALAWLRGRSWAPLLRLMRPELGLLQPTPRPLVEQVVRRVVPGAREGWAAAGVDEFLRAYLDPRGRAAFYAAARNIYLDEPAGEKGFWKRLSALEAESLFVWGRQDKLVPIAFMRHVEEALPAARHLELDCGHVPQVEAPRKVHGAARKFLLAG